MAAAYKLSYTSRGNSDTKFIIFYLFGNANVHAEMLPENKAAQTLG